MSDLTNLETIKRARAALPNVIRTTPIIPLAQDAAEIGNENLFLKCENMQVTGAYKIRAAFTALLALSDEARSKGVVMASSGNFAQAFAYAGREMGVPVAVVMLDSTSDYKVAQTKGHGAEVIFCGDDAMARQPTVVQVAEEQGMTAIDTWEFPPITAGHASIGMEILEQCPDVEQVLVPVSSGGAAAGIATAIKLQNSGVKMIGVQPEKANAAYVSMGKGELVTIDYWDSIADGLSARCPGSFPFRHLQAFMDEIVLISEQEIAEAFRTILLRAKQIGEPAGVVAPAGFLSSKIDTSLKTVATLTGGNLSMEVAEKMLTMSA